MGGDESCSNGRNKQKYAYTVQWIDVMCAFASAAVYTCESSPITGLEEEDMSHVEDFHREKEDFGCAVYKYTHLDEKGKEITCLLVAFRGTQSFFSWPNQWQNVPPALGSAETDRFAIDNARIIEKKFPGIKIFYTGHSKGGREAICAAGAVGGHAKVFNPDETHKGFLHNNTEGHSRVDAFVVEGEILQHVIYPVDKFLQHIRKLWRQNNPGTAHMMYKRLERQFQHSSPIFVQGGPVERSPIWKRSVAYTTLFLQARGQTSNMFKSHGIAAILECMESGARHIAEFKFLCVI
ncbi:hypothetical protein DPX39_050006500 [Trypanosoma brucei equiperdum]|uniref:Uncharacterized protein n=2 Tax=Trypanosoma brucei TaxID=5691 RepID=B2ZWB5_TRYB2|nr:hypothetical protein DPX39_050006500 [Trypanosoma brucei equiperdum]CAQ55503.1 hypothetical protein Tb927.5.293b [Trypanosoma brucei brucei TREU927]